MPVGEQDHRVVARAVARAFLGGAEERGDFVAGEVIAETRFVGHAIQVTATALPCKSVAARTTDRARQASHHRRASSVARSTRRAPASFCRPVF